MNPYLLKIASWHSRITDPFREKHTEGYEKAKLYGGAAIAGGIAQKAYKTAGGLVILPALLEASTNEGNQDHVKEFLKHHDMEDKVVIGHDPETLKRSGASDKDLKRFSKVNKPHAGPSLSQLSNGKFVIQNAKTPSGKMWNSNVLLHELGHAKDFSTGAKNLKGIGAILGRTGVGKIGAGVGAIAALQNEKTEKYAPAIAAAPSLLRFREEVMANKHGYDFLKKTHGIAEGNKFLRKAVAPNMMHYGLGIAAPVAATMAIGKYLKNHRKQD